MKIPLTQRSHVVFGRIFLSLPFQLVQRDEIDEGWRVRKKRNKMKKEKFDEKCINRVKVIPRAPMKGFFWHLHVVSTANLCKRERDDKREEEESKRDENRGRTTSTSISWGNALMKRLIGS